MISAALAILETDKQRSELDEFYKEHRNRLYALALSKLHNRYDAEDAVQETFLNIAKYPEKFFEIDAHKKISYVLVVIRNVISRMLKKANRCEFDELPENAFNNVLSVETLAIGNISAEEIKNFIEKMSPALRDAIKLKVFGKLSNTEIADVLNISETAVRKRISTAYKKINTFLNGGAYDERIDGK